MSATFSKQLSSLCAAACVGLSLALAGCANTWQGVQSDSADFYAWSKGRPSDFERKWGPVPKSYATINREEMASHAAADRVSLTPPPSYAQQRTLLTQMQLPGSGGAFSGTPISLTDSGSGEKQLVDLSDFYTVGEGGGGATLALPQSSATYQELAPMSALPVEYNPYVTVFPLDEQMDAAARQRLGADGYQQDYAYLSAAQPSQAAAFAPVGAAAPQLAHRVFFNSGSTSLTEIEKQELTQVARSLGQQRNAQIRVIGYASRDGASTPSGDLANARMSLKRANAVSSVLMSAGIAPNLIDTVGAGYDPLNRGVPGKDAAEAARRVDVYVEYY